MHSGRVPPTFSATAHLTRRTWPITVMLVTVALALMLVSGFAAAVQTTPFIGDTPSRDDYISARMACLASLPAFAGMIWFGWQRGSRVGLGLITVPAAVMVVVGLSLLATTGHSRDPDPTRVPSPMDLVGELTVVGWGATVVFLGGAVATHLLRRRARHTERVSGA